MTDAEKITTVQALVENDPAATEAIVGVYLADALQAILNWRYAFNIPEVYDISRWDFAQCKLAARYFLRRGAEGEITHNENGVNRTYASVDDYDILCQIPTIAKVM